MVSIQDLTFGYKKGGQLLSGLNLELHKGKVYGLFGLNGVGKTTLLNNIAGMLFPKSGTCLLDDVKTNSRTPEVLSKMYIVSEQFELPKLTGSKYVELHSLFYPDFSEELFHRILEEFEVDLSQKLHKLSFGQKKKFMITFAIATQAPLLILDEPTNGLDIPSKSQFRKIIASLDVDERCILISTHQVRDLGSILDHIIVLKDHKIVFNESLESINRSLSFQKLEENTNQDFIYGEETLGAINAVVPSLYGASNGVDLELLFNGIIQKTSEIKKQFEVKS